MQLILKYSFIRTNIFFLYTPPAKQIVYMFYSHGAVYTQNKYANSSETFDTFKLNIILLSMFKFVHTQDRPDHNPTTVE